MTSGERYALRCNVECGLLTTLRIIEAQALDYLCGYPWEDPVDTKRGIKAGSSVFQAFSEWEALWL